MTKRIVSISLLCLLSLAYSAHAQLRWGIRAGLATANKLPSSETFSGEGHKAFFGGVVAEYGVPFVPVFAEAALLYNQTNAHFEANKEASSAVAAESKTVTESRLNIPINVKLKLDIFPTIRGIFFAGPSFSIKLADSFDKWNELDTEHLQQQKASLGFQAGIGLEIFRALQISAQYAAPLGDNYKYEGANKLAEDFYKTSGKQLSFSATYFF